MADKFEQVEKVEKESKANADAAEAHLRAMERNYNSQPELRESQAVSEETSPVDTSQEWWNKKDLQPKESILNHAKEIAVVGAMGAVLIGNSLLLGHNGLEDNMNNIPDSRTNEVSQTQVVEKPAPSQVQFIETNQPFKLNHGEQLGSEEISNIATPEASTLIQPETASEQSQASWWHSVPEHSQHDMTYKGGNTEYGCVPTSASMVLDYWHQQDPANQTQTAQELLDSNSTQGEFGKYGMSSTNVHDDVGKLGYSAQDYTNSNLDELKGAVTDGPVLAIVKLGMKPDGTNHTVVVTGISDQNEVRVNDPWTGKSQTYSWEQFSKSWGANFGKDVPKNNFTTIRPKTL